MGVRKQMLKEEDRKSVVWESNKNWDEVDIISYFAIFGLLWDVIHSGMIADIFSERGYSWESEALNVRLVAGKDKCNFFV